MVGRGHRAGRRGGRLVARAPGSRSGTPPDLWLLFAPIKKARTDFIVEKAAELGAARIQPVFTRSHRQRAAAHRPAAGARDRGGRAVRRDLRAGGRRARAARGAARRLGSAAAADVLRRDPGRAPAARGARPPPAPGPWAILIGPEGGFAPEEALRLRSLPFVMPVTLGPRVLRADTAVCAALDALAGDARDGLAMSFIRPELAARLAPVARADRLGGARGRRRLARRPRLRRRRAERSSSSGSSSRARASG